MLSMDIEQAPKIQAPTSPADDEAVRPWGEAAWAQVLRQGPGPQGEEVNPQAHTSTGATPPASPDKLTIQEIQDFIESCAMNYRRRQNLATSDFLQRKRLDFAEEQYWSLHNWIEQRLQESEGGSGAVEEHSGEEQDVDPRRVQRQEVPATAEP